MYSYGHPHMAKQKQDDQLELTYSSYVRTQDVTLKTCQRRWMIGRSGERGSGISVLVARHDDDDDDVVCWTEMSVSDNCAVKWFQQTLCHLHKLEKKKKARSVKAFGIWGKKQTDRGWEGIEEENEIFDAFLYFLYFDTDGQVYLTRYKAERSV